MNLFFKAVIGILVVVVPFGIPIALALAARNLAQPKSIKDGVER